VGSSGNGSAQRTREPHVVILGGGPAGCGAAFELARLKRANVTLIEQREAVGGNAGSFVVDGIHLDYGSHRLHAATDPPILADIKAMLGADLADRERHGRILIRGKYVHFPLRAPDLMLRLDRPFALGATRDMAARTLFGKADPGETFASVLLANLGKTICEHFYFPYARKIWGRSPEALSGIQARKRVTAGSFPKLLKRLVRPPGKGRFYYPRRGYGQISEAYAESANKLGAELMLGWKVARLEAAAGAGRGWTVEATRDGESRIVHADQLWSTLPVSLLTRMVAPAPPAEVVAAAGQIEFRAMLLVYLELDCGQFTTTDAHYFPEEHIRMTRLSEPKNYFGVATPDDRTILCAEIPCTRDDALWTMSDTELGQVVVEDIRRAGLPLARPPMKVFVKRLAQAYPIYALGYERALERLESWVESLPDFLSYGRQGLFAHDNAHHALYMAYAAAACFENGRFDRARWADYRKVFVTHVVED
jgi:protoporphyrinogen oxidase